MHGRAPDGNQDSSCTDRFASPIYTEPYRRASRIESLDSIRNHRDPGHHESRRSGMSGTSANSRMYPTPRMYWVSERSGTSGMCGASWDVSLKSRTPGPGSPGSRVPGAPGSRVLPGSGCRVLPGPGYSRVPGSGCFSNIRLTSLGAMKSWQ